MTERSANTTFAFTWPSFISLMAYSCWSAAYDAKITRP